MVNVPMQGEIWWAEAEDKRRPVLIVTRSEVVEVLRWVVVAPITRSVRGIPTELPLDIDDGMRQACAATFDNIQPIRRALLTERIGGVGADRHQMICQRLSALADC